MKGHPVDRRLKRTAGLVGAVGLLAALSVRLVADPARRDLGRTLLVFCALILCAWLLAEVRRRLHSQRAAPLRPACRSPERPAMLSADLRAILSEVGRARRSREQFAKGLGSRLEGIAARRGEAVASGAIGDEERSGDRARERGMSAEEIGAAISRIEGA